MYISLPRHATPQQSPEVDAAAAAAIDIIDISCTNHGIALHYVQRPNCGQSPPRASRFSSLCAMGEPLLFIASTWMDG